MEDGHTPTSTEFVSHFYPTSGVAGRSISSFVPEDELERQRLAALAKRKRKPTTVASRSPTRAQRIISASKALGRPAQAAGPDSAAIAEWSARQEVASSPSRTKKTREARGGPARPPALKARGPVAMSTPHRNNDICSPPLELVEGQYYWRAVGAVSAAAVIWSHATNSIAELDAALKSNVQYLEVDVIMGQQLRSGLDELRIDTEEIPLCGHPPQTSSDLTIAALLARVISENRANQRKGKCMVGLKLDFKDPAAVAPTLDELDACCWNWKWPLLLNADVWRGPGGAEPRFDPRVFLNVCAMRAPGAGVSPGWTTGPVGDDRGSSSRSGLQGYQTTHIDQALHDITEVADGTFVTFPVRAGCLRRTAPAEVLRLIGGDGLRTLTVWGEDEADRVGLNQEFWRDRAFYDLKAAPMPVI